MNDQWLGLGARTIDAAAAADWLGELAGVQRRIAAADPSASRDLLSALRLAARGDGQVLQRYVQLGEQLQRLQALAASIAQIADAQWPAWLRLLEPLQNLPSAYLLSLPLKLKTAGAVGPLFLTLDGAAQLELELNAAGAPDGAATTLVRLGADGRFSLSAGATLPWMSGVFGGSLGGTATASAALEFDLWTPHAAADVAAAACGDALGRLCDPFDLAAVSALPQGAALRLAGDGALTVEISADVALLQAAEVVHAASLGYAASKRIAGKVQVEVLNLGQGVVRVSAFRQRGELTTRALKASVGLSLSSLADGLAQGFADALGALLPHFGDRTLLQRPGAHIANRLKPAIDAQRGAGVEGRWIDAAERRLHGRINSGLPGYLGSLLDVEPSIWRADGAAQAALKFAGAFGADGGLPPKLAAAVDAALAAGVGDWQAALKAEIAAFDDAARADLQRVLATAGIQLPALPNAPAKRAAALLDGLMQMMQQGRARLAQALDLLHAAADAAIELRIEHGVQQSATREACIIVDIDAHADPAAGDGALAEAYRAAFAGDFTPLQRLSAAGDARILDLRGSLREMLSRKEQTRVALSLLNTALLDEALYASDTTLTRAFDGSVELLSRASYQRRRSLFGEAQTVRCVDVFSLLAAQVCAGVNVALTVSQQDQHFEPDEFRAFVEPLEQAAMLPAGTAQRVVALLADPRGASLFGRGELSAGLPLGLPQLRVLFALGDAAIAQVAARHLVEQVYADAVRQVAGPLSRVPSWPADPAAAALQLAQRMRTDVDFDKLAGQICAADGTPALPGIVNHYKAFLRQLWSAGRSANGLAGFIGVLRSVSSQAPTAQQCEDLQLQASQKLRSWLKPEWEAVLKGSPSARFVALLRSLAELATQDGAQLRVSLWFSVDGQQMQLLA